MMNDFALRSVALIGCFAAAISCTAPSVSNDKAATKPVAAKIAAPAKLPPVEAAKNLQVATEAYRNDFWFNRDPVQGGLVIGRMPSDTREVRLNGAAVMISPDGYFLMGFDRDADNSASLTAILRNGQTVDRYLPVKPSQWKIENVNASATGGAGTTAEFKARRGGELAQISRARSLRSDAMGWRQNFIWPVTGRISGLFGSQRIYRGSPGSYHSGLDIAVPTGTTFVAPADGVITLAAKSPFTLEGNLLMMDHGMGLNSAFLHCSELLVREGEFVRQGQIIGRVGATGRASGPHLHWGMRWNGAKIDPKFLVPARQ
jgi:murein DD-endopeptidase MepM/ murein hydrolase activator NlpD